MNEEQIASVQCCLPTDKWPMRSVGAMRGVVSPTVSLARAERAARVCCSRVAAWVGFVAMGWLVLQCSLPQASAQPAIDNNSLAVVSALEDATVGAIESAERSVVAISRVRRNRSPSPLANQLRPEQLRLGNPFPAIEAPDNPDYVPTLFGSGVVISDDGYIVTCGHVLDDPREHDYFVWLDKESYSARVVGMPAKVLASDPFSDLAVLKIDASGLNPARFNTAPLRKGQFVIALGNPHAIARDGRASASWGIVSNLGRVAPTDKAGEENKETLHHYGTLIQTDAKLNLGTSGGALVNLKGEVVGITTALAATSGYEQSAGFAIATDELFLRVIETLKAGKLPEYGFLGIQPEDLKRADKVRGLSGARVSVVIPGLPGELAGLQADDVIFQIDQKPIADRNDLFLQLSKATAGREVLIYVQRTRPGRNTPDVLQLPAMLSKKPMATRRPGYAVNSAQPWRGLLVEYATAIQSEVTRSGLGGSRNSYKLAVLTVEPDTPAWKAGLRTGHGILAVEGTKVETPDEFYRLVGELSGVVEVRVIRHDQRAENIAIEPPEIKSP